jgi:hypothetical protein
MQALPVRASKRAREIANQAENIMRKLHINRKYMYIGSGSIFMRKGEYQNECRQCSHVYLEFQRRNPY